MQTLEHVVRTVTAPITEFHRHTLGVRLAMSAGCCSSPPTEPAHSVGDGRPLPGKRARLIEKLKGKQIFSIGFARLCPLTVPANVPVAKQSTSHCASDNRGGRNHSVFVGLSHAFPHYLVPYMKERKVKHSMSK